MRYNKMQYNATQYYIRAQHKATLLFVGVQKFIFLIVS